MKDFLDQVETATDDNRLYYLALAGALAIPDLCGALASKDGKATKEGFAAWFDTNVSPLHLNHWDNKEPFLTGADCYSFRCSFLHQGRLQTTKGGYERIGFLEPGGPVTMHMNIIYLGGDRKVLNIDARLFCHEVVDSARTWLATVVGTEPYETNLTSFVTRYPNGLAPFAAGAPVIA